jgi:hypothetical protein
MNFDFLTGFINEIIVGICVWIYSKSRPYLKKIIRQSKIRKFFGNSSLNKEKIALIIPIFKLVLIDDFSKGSTIVKKYFYDFQRNLILNYREIIIK